MFPQEYLSTILPKADISQVAPDEWKSTSLLYRDATTELRTTACAQKIVGTFSAHETACSTGELGRWRAEVYLRAKAKAPKLATLGISTSRNCQVSEPSGLCTNR